MGWRVWVSLPVRPRPARRWVSRAGGPLWGVHVGQGSREGEELGSGRVVPGGWWAARPTCPFRGGFVLGFGFLLRVGLVEGELQLGVEGFAACLAGGDEGGEHALDFGGGEIGGVEEAEGGLGVAGGHDFAEAVAELFERLAEVGRQVAAGVEQEEVGLGEVAPVGSGGGEVGGAVGGGAIGRVGGDVADGGVEIHQVGFDELGEQAFEVAIIMREAGDAHPDGFGEVLDREAAGAELGEGAAADGADEVMALRVPLFEEGAGFGQVLGEGADGSGWVVHGRRISNVA